MRPALAIGQGKAKAAVACGDPSPCRALPAELGSGSARSAQSRIPRPPDAGGAPRARYLNGGPNDALYEDAVDTGARAELALGNCGPQTAGFFHLHRSLVDWVFVDNPVFHRPGARRPPPRPLEGKLPHPSGRRPRGCPVAGLRAMAARAAGRRPAPVLARAWSARALTRPVLDLHLHPADSRPRRQQQNAPMLPAGSHGRRAARRDPLWQLARRLWQQPVPERVGCADPTLRARRAGNPYGDEHGVFGDNQFRYALLSLAACEAPLQLRIGGFRCAARPGRGAGPGPAWPRPHGGCKLRQPCRGCEMAARPRALAHQAPCANSIFAAKPS